MIPETIKFLYFFAHKGQINFSLFTVSYYPTASQKSLTNWLEDPETITNDRARTKNQKN